MTYAKFKKAVLIGLFMPIFVLPFQLKAQELSCKTEAEKIACQKALAQVEAEQKQAAIELATAQNKSASLSRDIEVLDAKIRAAQLEIKAKNILIQSLGNDIAVKERQITKLEDRIERGRDTLAQILRKTNEFGDYSLPEIVLSQDTISGLFNELDEFGSVEEGLKTTFEQIRNDKASTTAQKEVLSDRRDSAIDAKYVIQQQQKNIESNQAERKKLLTISKGNEKAYSALIAEKQAKAAQIRAALFSLRDATAIPFEQALQYATLAYKKTGVRPAFILAIITQESSLGKNVGSCLLSSLSTGDGIGKNTGTAFEKVMKAPRDTEPFNRITSSLGRSWSTTPVSCPIGGTKYYLGRGYGGAMGPAQFIASTWALLEDRLKSALGIPSEPDPWNPAHAFMASALYLSDLGAGAGTYSAELRAACSYYGSGGSTCTYGKQVMALVDSIQREKIDPLQGL